MEVSRYQKKDGNYAVNYFEISESMRDTIIKYVLKGQKRKIGAVTVEYGAI